METILSPNFYYEEKSLLDTVLCGHPMKKNRLQSRITNFAKTAKNPDNVLPSYREMIRNAKRLTNY